MPSNKVGNADGGMIGLVEVEKDPDQRKISPDPKGVE